MRLVSGRLIFTKPCRPCESTWRPKVANYFVLARVPMLYLPECPGIWAEVVGPMSFNLESRQRNSLISSPMRILLRSEQFSNSVNLLRPGGLRCTRSCPVRNFVVNLTPGLSLGLRIYSLSPGKSRNLKLTHDPSFPPTCTPHSSSSTTFVDECGDHCGRFRAAHALSPRH